MRIGNHEWIRTGLRLVVAATLLAAAGCRAREDGRSASAGEEPGRAASAASTGSTASGVDSPSAEAAARQPERSLFSRVFRRAPIEVTVPAGSVLAVQITDGVSSQSSAVGDAISGQVVSEVRIGEHVAIPAGSTVHGAVTAVRPLRRIGGRAQIAVAFSELELPNGDSVPIAAGASRLGKSETRKDTATIVGSTIAGAVLGHQIDDDDKGKIVGGAVGAGVGTAIAAKTRGQAVGFPSGSRLSLRLRNSVTVEAAS
jgi:type IV secretory pathway VirB10-like protein